MGMSQVIRLLSAGEAETRKLPWGLQESDVTGAWPGEVSTRTQLVRNLQKRERERERVRERAKERERGRERGEGERERERERGREGESF